MKKKKKFPLNRKNKFQRWSTTAVGNTKNSVFPLATMFNAALPSKNSKNIFKFYAKVSGKVLEIHKLCFIMCFLISLSHEDTLSLSLTHLFLSLSFLYFSYFFWYHNNKNIHKKKSIECVSCCKCNARFVCAMSFAER